MIRFLVDTYERAILWLLVIQFFFVNIIFTTTTQNIVILKDLSAPLFSILILGFWVCGDLAKTGRWFLPRHGVVPAMAGALIFWGFSVVGGSSTAHGFEVWVRTFCYFVQTWAILRFVNSVDRMKFLLRCFLITNIPLIFYGLTQIMNRDLLVELGIIPEWGGPVFVSTHGNQNFYAGYLITTFPALLGYWLVTRSQVLIAGLPILLIMNVHQVLFSTARGALLGMTVFFPLFILVMFANRRHLHIVEDVLRKRLFQFVAIVLIIGIVIGGVLFFDHARNFVNNLVIREFRSLLDFESTYVNIVRLIFWQMALDGALQYPWFGRGIGSYNWNMPETRFPGYHRLGVSHNTDHPHNEHLEWLHDTGIIGLAFFWWILAAYFWTGVREIRRHRKGYYFPLVLASFGGPWMLWIQATFDVESRWTGNNVTLWTSLGFFLAFRNLPVILKRGELVEAKADVPAVRPGSSRRRSAGRAQPTLPKLNPSPYLPYVAACFALVTLFYLVKARDYWQADYHLRNNMMHTGAGGNIQQAILESERARDLAYTVLSNYYKLAYSYLVAGRLDDALVTYRDLQTFAPNYAQIHINLAFLNDQLGYRIASASSRDRAALIERNARNHRDAAHYWLQLGFPKRAIAHLRQCLTMKTDRTPGIFHIMWNEFDSVYADLARIYLSLGDRKQAFFALERALRFNSSNKSAGLLLAELQGQPDKKEEVDRLLTLVIDRSPDNPALLIFSMGKAIEERRYADALATATRAAALLSLPPLGGQPDQEMVGFGNSLLQGLQKIFTANHDQARCFAVAGWIYACQGRYQEADQFLGQAFQALRDPKIAEQLGQVRARLGG